MNPIDADSAALAGAGSVAEEALALHREALAILKEGWQSQSGCAATDLIRHQCGDAAELVSALHGAATEMGSLRDALAQTDADGVDAAQDNFARTAARLGDRPEIGFDASAPPPGYSATATPAVQQAPAVAPTPIPLPLPTSGGVLPGLGGAVGGAVAALVAQLAGELRPDAANATASDVKSDAAVKGPPHSPRPGAAPIPLPVTHAGAPAAVPVPMPAPAPVPLPPNDPGPQPPPPDLPLLAAERPPEPPASPSVPADDPTPCEIAADELPHAG